jgi:Glycosyl hydrolase family 57
VSPEPETVEPRAADPQAVDPRAPGVTAPGATTSRSPSAAEQARLICLFHLNLAFSSLEEEAHADVVRSCYHPMLELVEQAGFPIAVEATGWTLRRIAAVDAGWIERARALLADGRMELVGSAHAQCAAPLLPAAANVWNLRLGRDVYRELLGVTPRIALVCEQVFSPGLVPLYRDAGYEAVIVDWDNAYRSHRDWPLEHRRHPQRALGGGASIPLVWSESIAFQKFQRFAHGELAPERYVEFVRDAAGSNGGALMLYANDAEVFDHRPGRFAAEPELGEDEWGRIAAGLRALREAGVGVPALPSELLALLDEPRAGHELALEAADQPIPVKKQDKYNVTRWAVTGRDDIGINTRCWRIYERLHATGCTDADAWRELCELWASDFRTHITDARWSAYLERLEAVERRWSVEPPAGGVPLGQDPQTAPRDELRPAPADGPPLREELEAPSGAFSREGSFVELRAGELTLRLNTRRGLAIDALTDARVCEQPLLGTLEHGYFPTIDLGADFYSGHLVQEAPVRQKVTDLERVEPALGLDERGRVCALAWIPTSLGAIEKAVRVDPAEGSVELEWTLHFEELPLGSLRLGHVTLFPEAFDLQTLWYATHNGGAELETHSVGGPEFDHGGAVSALVSSRQGLGLTEGVVLIGDARRTIRVEVDQACARLLGLVAWTPAGERWFLRLSFSLSESDDTRRGAIPRDPAAPQRARLRISAERTPGG